MSIENRRPITSRQSCWANNVAAYLAYRTPITPNQISVFSVIFALIGAILLLTVPSMIGYVLTAICIQLRLVCNLLDGMVAVEGGKKTADGALFNEVPDRVADSLLIIAAGYATGYAWLGWLTALLAVTTAYIRVLGGSLAQPQLFSGPMAKPHRMALLTLACVITAVECHYHADRYALLIALIIMAVGTGITCIVRLKQVKAQLDNAFRSQPPE